MHIHRAEAEDEGSRPLPHPEPKPVWYHNIEDFLRQQYLQAELPGHFHALTPNGLASIPALYKETVRRNGVYVHLFELDLKVVRWEKQTNTKGLPPHGTYHLPGAGSALPPHMSTTEVVTFKQPFSSGFMHPEFHLVDTSYGLIRERMIKTVEIAPHNIYSTAQQAAHAKKPHETVIYHGEIRPQVTYDPRRLQNTKLV